MHLYSFIAGVVIAAIVMGYVCIIKYAAQKAAMDALRAEYQTIKDEYQVATTSIRIHREHTAKVLETALVGIADLREKIVDGIAIVDIDDDLLDLSRKITNVSMAHRP